MNEIECIDAIAAIDAEIQTLLTKLKPLADTINSSQADARVHEESSLLQGKVADLDARKKTTKSPIYRAPRVAAGTGMRPIGVFVVVVLVLCPTLAFPQPTYRSFGKGMASCGEFLQAAEAERKARPPTARSTEVYNRDYLAFLMFADGFLTGANVWDITHSELGKETDTQGRMAWIENYCRANPLDHFSNAVIGLRGYLRGEGQ
jgi:hypothetical protein